MFLTVISLLVGLLTLLWLWSKKKFSVFRTHGIPEDPATFPLGSSATWCVITGGSFQDMYDKAYKDFRDKPFVGTYGMMGSLNFIIIDEELIKTVLIKDFDYMVDRREFKMHNEYLDNMMTQLEGEQWREMRALMTPVFTSGKLKAMLPIINKVGGDFVKFLEKHADEKLDLELKDIMMKYSLEVIASAGFGIESQAFNDPDGVFSDQVDRMLRRGKYQIGTLKAILQWSVLLAFPKLMEWFPGLVEFVPTKPLDFFVQIIKTQMEQRAKSTGDVARNDMIDLVVDALKAADSKSFPDKRSLEVAAISNIFILFFAGFDTTSTSSAATCHFLAIKPDCQEKAYQEIKEAVEENNGDPDLDYSAIQKLEYLEQCIHESNRAYPIVIIERKVTKPWPVPGTNYVLPKGSMVTVPAIQMARDPAFYENPDDYNPDNFNQDAEASRSQYINGTFGHGPRNCIGKRFALLQMKVGLAHLLYNYKLVPSEKTNTGKLEMDMTSQSGTPKGGLWIRIEKRN